MLKLNTMNRQALDRAWDLARVSIAQADTPQVFGKVGPGLRTTEGDGRVTDQACGAVGRRRMDPVRRRTGL